MEPYAVVLTALWTMLPAYVPNNVAVLAGGGRPVDGGRRLGGQRLLGDGKTWRGTIIGITAGGALALGLDRTNDAAATLVAVDLPEFAALAVLALPAGAMLGDIAASFLKRRTGRERGAPFPLVDQLDFVVGALIFAAVLAPVWFQDVFTPGVIVAVALVSPLLHVVTNAFAYWVGLKDEPW